MSISLSHVSVASCCSTFSPEKLDVVAGVIPDRCTPSGQAHPGMLVFRDVCRAEHRLAAVKSGIRAELLVQGAAHEKTRRASRQNHDENQK